MLQHIARLAALPLSIAILACAPAVGPAFQPGPVVAVGATPPPASSPAAPDLSPGNRVPLPPPPPSVSLRGPYEVAEVVDGDTIKLELDGQVESVRLIGIDTPETVHPTRPVQCYGPESTRYLETLLAGQTVMMAADPTQDARDRDGRMLAYVWTSGSNLNVNGTLVMEGYGREYTYERPYEFQALFRDAQRRAKEARRGLWGLCPDAEAWAAGDDDSDTADAPVPRASAPDPRAPSITTSPSPGGLPNAGASAPEPGSTTSASVSDG